MKNYDTVQHFIFEKSPIRGEIVHLNQCFKEIMDKHNYPPLIRQWLGEALVLVTLLSSIIKFEGKLSIQFQGKGKLKLLLVQCDNNLHLRGLAQWEGELVAAEMVDSLKQGNIIITLEPENGKHRHQGIVAWQGETLTESIEGYFQNSEQLPTRIWVTVDENCAAGFLLQMMPDKKDKDLITADNDWEHFCILTDTITPSELLNLKNEELLHRLYVEEDVRVFESKLVIFRCTCSAKRGANAIMILGRKEVEEELVGKNEIVVRCEFCNHGYTFDRVDVARIFRDGGDIDEAGGVH